MLSLEEKKSRLETLLKRVRVNRVALDSKLAAETGETRETAPQEAVDASAPASVETPETLPQPAEPKPVRLSSWPPPPAKSVPVETEAVGEPIEPVEPEPLAPRSSYVEIAEPAAASESVSRMDEAVEAEPVAVSASAVEVAPEPEPESKAADSEDIDDIPPVLSMGKVAAEEPAVSAAEPPPEVATPPETQAFEPNIVADAPVVEVKGTPAVDWTLKGVLERAWAHGAGKPRA